LRPQVPAAMPVGTIIAVGPFVETVEQPAADLAGTTRVLHPTPTSMLAATVSLATAKQPFTIEQVRTLLGRLAPETAQLSSEMLAGEGFSTTPAQEMTMKLPPVPAAPPKPRPQVAPPPKPIEVTTPVPRITARVPFEE